MSGTALATLAAGAGGALGRAAGSLDAARADGRLGHAYLLVGPSGAGKRTLASALAKDILGFIRADGTHPDLTLLAPEEGKREIGIDLVRAACLELSLAPLEAPGRMALVHGADLLGEEAASALLKTLEEPPPGGVLVLTTARPEAVMPTIRSRCMALRLPPRTLATSAPPAVDATQANATQANATQANAKHASAKKADAKKADAKQANAKQEDPLVALARAGEALLEPGGDPFDRAAKASAIALEVASEGEEGERPALEKRRRAVLTLLDSAGARVALRVRERSREGFSIAAEEAALERFALAAECIEANATPELVLEVLSVDLAEIAGSLGPLAEPPAGRGGRGFPPPGQEPGRHGGAPHG